MSKNLIVAHGGGPTAVINSSLAGVISEAKKYNEIDHIYAARGGALGLLNEDFIELENLTVEEINRLKETPSSAIGSCRYKVTENDHGKIIEILEKYNIGYFFYNGGNDSMDTCNKVSKIADDIKVIGIPKTIDNDLDLTDHSPGFGSCARYNAITTLELGLDVRALPIHLCIIELMGRNAGWLTASSALARKEEGDAPHLIYLPERPFIEEKFYEDIKKAKDRYGGIVVAVSEGLKYENGESIADSGITDGFGHKIPGGVASALSDKIIKNLGIKSRSEKPGLIARASKLLVSSVDIEEAFNAGSFAVKSALEGNSGFMVGYKRVSNTPYKIEYQLIELEKVANKEKKMPDNYINDEGNDVTESFIDYCKPLLGNEFPDYYRLKL